MLVTDITTNRCPLLYSVLWLRQYFTVLLLRPFPVNTRTWARLWFAMGLWAFEVRKWFTHNYAVFFFFSWTGCYVVRFIFVLDVPSRQLQLGCTSHHHRFYLVCPDLLSLVGELLSGEGRGSPNHIVLITFFFYLLIHLFLLLSSQTNK